MKITVNPERNLFTRNPMLYGHFLEHFHRQIEGGVFAPGHPLSDEDGFRRDVLEALKNIQVPIIRWPGGCFVSAYHWKNGVGKERIPSYDKAWRVEDSNHFGTDEFILLCKKLGCEPYICTNAGSGTPEEMSDWVEYCNLPSQGEWARRRIAGGHPDPYGVRYWSVGNENYYDGEIGAKTKDEWGHFVSASALMMKRVDPGIQLSAAAIADVGWNVNLLKEAGSRLNLISIHGYWDPLWQENKPAGYEQCMAVTDDLDRDVRKVRGLLAAFGLEKQIGIAYDEWNLRGWHHPRVDYAPLGDDSFIRARDENDLNRTYTMADAVFSACFLNMLLRNADAVQMANFAPVVNTRGAIYTWDGGIVLRPTYYVFELFTRQMGDRVLDSYTEEGLTVSYTNRYGETKQVDQVDTVATRCSEDGTVAVSLINKHAEEEACVTVRMPFENRKAALYCLNGPSKDSFNDVDASPVFTSLRNELITKVNADEIKVTLPPHSVSVLRLSL